jgi:hypothetical protein
MQPGITYKSAVSNPSGNCVTIRIEGGVVLLGDDKLPGQPELPFQLDSWRGGRAVRFIAIHRSAVPAEHLAARPDAITWYRVTKQGVSLFFDEAERNDFVAAIDDQKWVPALAGNVT